MRKRTLCICRVTGDFGELGLVVVVQRPYHGKGGRRRAIAHTTKYPLPSGSTHAIDLTGQYHIQRGDRT